MRSVDWAVVRRWGYVVAAAGIPLLVAYGIVTADKAPLWVAFAGAALGFPVAALNTHSDALATRVADKVSAQTPSTAEMAAGVADAVAAKQQQVQAVSGVALAPSASDVLDPGVRAESPASVAV